MWSGVTRPCTTASPQPQLVSMTMRSVFPVTGWADSARGGFDLGGPGRADVGLAAPLLQPVGHAAVDLVGGLPGPAGVGADDPHLLPGADALGQAVPALVRLPAAHRGQAGVGRVALGDPVPDDPDLRGEVLLRLALGRRDDLLVPGRAGELPGEALSVDFEQRGAFTPGAALAEPAQVERQAGVLLARARRLSRLLEPTPFGITG